MITIKGSNPPHFPREVDSTKLDFAEWSNLVRVQMLTCLNKRLKSGEDKHPATR
jgi:hypothetical protein